jgi:hypothetical protein
VNRRHGGLFSAAFTCHAPFEFAHAITPRSRASFSSDNPRSRISPEGKSNKYHCPFSRKVLCDALRHRQALIRLKLVLQARQIMLSSAVQAWMRLRGIIIPPAFARDFAL